jgi:hypothetical protein
MLNTDLTWKPRAVKNGPGVGALVGTLYGVPVNGRSIGRGVAYQLVTILGDVYTVWWDGTVSSNLVEPYLVYPYLYQVDTGDSVTINPSYVAEFYKL